MLSVVCSSRGVGLTTGFRKETCTPQSVTSSFVSVCIKGRSNHWAPLVDRKTQIHFKLWLGSGSPKAPVLKTGSWAGGDGGDKTFP